MISIVIPTMWYFQPFVRYLNDLVNCNVINDITIIDNRSEHRPDDPVFTNNKIKIITPVSPIVLDVHEKKVIVFFQFDREILENGTKVSPKLIIHR